MSRNVRNMTSKPTAIERAFQLAKSGRYDATKSLRKALRAEGYSDFETDGPALQKQLREEIRLARESQQASTGTPEDKAVIGNKD